MPAILVFAVVFCVLAGTATAGLSRRTQAVVCLSILILVLGGNRFNGADWIHYKSGFESLADEFNPFVALSTAPFEWVFSLLLWSVTRTGAPYEVLVFLIGLVNSLTIVYIASRLPTTNIAWPIALLFLVEGWMLYHEQLRQSLAINLSLIALIRLHDKSPGTAILAWLLATGCHSSAWLMPLVAAVARMVYRNKGQPLRLQTLLVIAASIYTTISMATALIRAIAVPGLERIRLKLDLYQEHDVFGATLFTAGMAGYAIGFIFLLWTRRIVVQANQAWFSLAWSMAMLWSLLGPLLRTQAILIRFEHYFLIFLPLAMGLTMEYAAGMKRSRPAHFSVAVMAVLFSATFPLRVFLHPENIVWTLNYENSILALMTFTGLEDAADRADNICLNLALFGNDFCGRALE